MADSVDRLPALAADRGPPQVAVIVATRSRKLLLAAKAVPSTVPIVVTLGGDPVKAGLVAGVNRPGRNIPGVAIAGVELEA